MKQCDFLEFSNAWADAHEIMAGGKALSERAMGLCFSALEAFTIESIRAALTRHIQSAKFAPTPNDIIALLNPNYRISADEALARIPKSEEDSVLWTREMAAAYAVAYPMFEEGRWFDGSRAFKSAYERECQANEHNPVAYTLSLGSDPKGRELAVKKAVSLGVISQELANKHLLPNPENAGVIAGLLFDESSSRADEETREKWRLVKKSLSAGVARTEKRITVINSKLSGNVSDHERYLLNSELDLLLASQANRQEAEARKLKQEADGLAFEESRRVALDALEQLMKKQSEAVNVQQ